MPKNWAIVIGINEYDRNSLNPLKYARQDAELIRDFFHAAKFEQVWFFSDDSPDVIFPEGVISTRPTYGQLMNFLHHQFKQPFLTTGDNCWFFFAGHGERYQGQDFLMPQDCTPEAIEKTAIPLSYIRERLMRSGADNVILILDACRSEGSRSGIGIGHEEQQGVITISSCSPTQKSWEIDELQHGVFTYVLHEALQTPGERNCTTVERLDQYLHYHVPELCRRHRKPEQTPRIAVDLLEKRHFILLPQYASNTDLLRSDLLALKNDAYRATSNRDFDLAEQIWRRVLGINGCDNDAVSALQNIAVMKVGHASSLPVQPVQKSESTGSRNTQAQPATPKLPEDDLRSEKGIDYTRLRDRLRQGDWKLADRETSTALCQMADRMSDRWLRANDVTSFSKRDLTTINQLWTRYSDGKFGFGAQKQIWKACGSPTAYGEKWDKFMNILGWYENGQPNRYGYSYYPRILEAPRGHFPRDFAFTALDGGTARGRAEFPMSLTTKLLGRAF